MLFWGLLLALLQSSPSFWSYWGDGKAELCAYDVTQNRYGQERSASVVMIYVTEPFLKDKQVKADAPGKGDPNVVQVLKLNRIKKFQTGIYDYSIFTSVFAPVNNYSIGRDSYAAGAPLKVAMSSQEWCGTVYHQLNRREKGIVSQVHSYFETEADAAETLRADNRTMLADELFIAVRELLAPMKTGTVTLYSTLEYSRLFHVPLAPASATIGKKDSRFSFEGRKTEVVEWTVDAGEQSWNFTVEKAYPHKILAYSHRVKNTLVENATLKKSVRLPYWELHDGGEEKYLKQLDMQPIR